MSADLTDGSEHYKNLFKNTWAFFFNPAPGDIALLSVTACFAHTSGVRMLCNGVGCDLNDSIKPCLHD